MAIKLEINMTNKWLYSLIAVGVVLALGVGVYAYQSNMRAGNPPIMGHSAGELNVDINGDGVADKSLQQAIDDKNFEGTGGPINCVWEPANRYGSNTKDGYYIAGISLGGCGRSGTAGCVSSIYWCQ